MIPKFTQSSVVTAQELLHALVRLFFFAVRYRLVANELKIALPEPQSRPRVIFPWHCLPSSPRLAPSGCEAALTELQLLSLVAGVTLTLGAVGARGAVKSIIAAIYLGRMGPLNRLVRNRSAPVANYQAGALRILRPYLVTMALAGPALLVLGLTDVATEALGVLRGSPALIAVTATAALSVGLLASWSLRDLGCLDLPTEAEHNDGPLCLYLSRESVEPGETMHLHVHAPEEWFDLAIERVVPGNSTLMTSEARQGRRQALPGCAFFQPLDWPDPVLVSIPVDWPSGLYSAVVRDSETSTSASFIVRSSRERRPRVVVLANTNTWAAYNAWGGASLYEYNLRDGSDRQAATEVSTLRPNPSADVSDVRGHLAGGETHLLHWLEQSGIDFSMVTDRDLHEEAEALNGALVLILNTHPEYWTAEMLDTVVTFLDHGGSLLALSGNSMYWRTTMSRSTIEVQKGRERHRMDGRRGGTWTRLGRPERAVLGVSYTGDGYNTYAPYVVAAPEHWLFEGTGVTHGDCFGQRSLVTATGEEGASGWETDKTGRGTPKHAVTIARGKQNGGAEMVYFQHQAGGHVLAAGSITSASAVPVCPLLERVVMNFLARSGVQSNANRQQ